MAADSIGAKGNRIYLENNAFFQNPSTMYCLVPLVVVYTSLFAAGYALRYSGSNWFSVVSSSCKDEPQFMSEYGYLVVETGYGIATLLMAQIVFEGFLATCSLMVQARWWRSPPPSSSATDEEDQAVTQDSMEMDDLYRTYLFHVMLLHVPLCLILFLVHFDDFMTLTRTQGQVFIGFLPGVYSYFVSFLLQLFAALLYLLKK